MIALLLAVVMQAPVQGPIVDAILDRISRNHEQDTEQFGAIGGRLEQLVERIREQGVEDEQRFGKLGDRLESLVSAANGLRNDLDDVRAEWRPLQNLADRLIALGWKLILIVVLFGVLVEGTRMLVYWLLSRLLVNPFRESKNA